LAEIFSEKGGYFMRHLVELVLGVVGAVAAHYIIKWLDDRDDKKDS